MADYIRPTPVNTRYSRTDEVVFDLVDPYGGREGQEGALLNGLLAMGYDPAVVRSFADADVNRRFLADAVTRALRAGVSEADIQKALRVTRLAATGDPDAAIRELGVDPNNLPPESRAAFDAIATRQPLPFLDRGDIGWRDMGRPVEQQRSGTGGPPSQPASAGAPTLSGQVPGAGAGAPGAGAGPGAGATPPPRKLTPAEIRADIEARYGWAAAFMDIPEIAQIMNDAANGTISAEEANRRWLGSNYYKSTSVNERNWRMLEKSSPGEAAQQMEGQVTTISQRANGLGIDLDPARVKQIAELSKRFGWSDQQIAAAIASEAKYDPTGAKTGVMAQIKEAQQNMLVPLSDQSMTQWAQAIIKGDQTIEDFNAYLKDQAKSLFPTLATYLDQTPGGNVKTYLDPYAQTISKTLGMPAGDIDWMDPKWFRFVNASDPKTGERRTVDIADVQRTLIADPQYGFDQTANGKQQKASFARTVLQDWGYLAGNEGGLR